MKIKELGEFSFIKRIEKKFLHNLPPGITGIGDDCAVIPNSQDQSFLVSTDMLVEDVHFLREAISAQDLGYKSLAVNISDIAAMGGRPLYFFLSLALPPDLELSWTDDFYQGLDELCQEHGIFLLGGDTTQSEKKIIVNVTIMGEIHPQKIKKRSQAKVGDVIAVTSPLGGSAAGLSVILNQDCREKYRALVELHHRPRPQVAEGLFLAQFSEVHALMDLSDGLSQDIKRILEQAKVGADLQLESLPFLPQLKKYADSCGVDLYEWTLSGGEDYALLTTIEAKAFPRLAQEFAQKFQRPLTQVGTITAAEQGLRFFEKDKLKESIPQGFDHFKSPRS